MTQYFKNLGEQLLDQGYLIVPLPPGSKGPRIKGWPNLKLDKPTFHKMAANGSAEAGIGVLARYTPAIDVDILDEQAAQEMSDLIDEIFAGQALMTRTGRAPKFLIPFRSDDPFKKLTSSVYTDGENDHKVEILGDGQQWVAYHIHPETLRPYDWWDGLADDGIRSTARESLPCLSRSNAQRVIDAFEILATKRVSSGAWKLKAGAISPAADRNADAGGDPFLAHAEPVGKGAEEVRALLARHPNAEADYDHWFQVLAAVHHELGEEGEDVARAWSTEAHKHTDAKFDLTWNSLGRYTGRQVTLRSLLKGEKPAEHKPRLVAVSEDDPWPQIEWEEFKQGFESIPWIIKGFLPQAEIGFLYGASGSGKTFLALDLAACIARGGEWRGHRITPVPVVYIAAEAGEGIKKRMAAYDKEFGAEGPRPRIMAGVPNLLSADDVDKIVKSTNLRGGAGLVIVDTMAASHTGDENSSKDMALFVNLCKDISAKTGAMVLIVHHTGKDDTKGVRGHSSLFAAADVVLEVVKVDNLSAVKVVKQKDGESGREYGFSLKVVQVGVDQEGETITTCVVRAEGEVPVKKSRGRKKPDFENDERMGKQRFYLDIISGLAGLANNAVPESIVINAIQSDKTVNPDMEENHPRADSIHRTLLRLAKQGKLAVEADSIRLLF